MRLTTLIFASALLIQTITSGQTIGIGDPVLFLKWHLRNIEPQPWLTFKTNGMLVLCTATCKDLVQRNAVFDTFKTIPNAGVTGTKEPPTASVQIPLNFTEFQKQQQTSRQQALMQKKMMEQQARQRLAADQAQRTLARRIDTEPEKLYGQQFTVDGEYQGLEKLSGDRPYEVGFRILERGTDHLSCVAFAAQVAGDPITLSVPMTAALAVRTLHVNDRVRITGKVLSPSMSEVTHLRRSQAFFVALVIERL